ncbi:trehalose-phosphatase [Pseudofulvimonas gallinarii]
METTPCDEVNRISTVTPAIMRRAAPSAAPAPVADLHGRALFLDVDGTLLDIAARPDAIRVPAGLVTVLARLSDRLDGALALVSGRAIDELDSLFAPLQLPTAGLHGLEIRLPDGTRSSPAGEALAGPVRAEALAFAAGRPGVIVEDKRHTLAVHFRLAPDAEGAVDALARGWLATLGAGWEIQRGKAVVEIRPVGRDKGTALATLMRQAPFDGRVPLMVGDDLTDEHAFDMAATLGGHGVLVGHRQPSAARFRLPDPAAVRAWLADMAQPLQESRR